MARTGRALRQRAAGRYYGGSRSFVVPIWRGDPKPRQSSTWTRGSEFFPGCRSRPRRIPRRSAARLRPNRCSESDEPCQRHQFCQPVLRNCSVATAKCSRAAESRLLTQRYDPCLAMEQESVHSVASRHQASLLKAILDTPANVRQRGLPSLATSACREPTACGHGHVTTGRYAFAGQP